MRRSEVSNMNLIDSYGRPINSLRISLTQRCNFACFFCHHEGEHDSHGEMTIEEIESVVEVASEMGIRKIKLTGGEPLLRGDITDIVKRISPYVDEVSMTTNGSHLQEKACKLKEAGLKRVNISLHSLKPDVFKKITHSDSLNDVKNGIKAAIKCELDPVKINMVVMRGINSEEIKDMIAFSRKQGAILQLIEFQALEDGVENYDEYHQDLHPIQRELERLSENIKERALHRRKKYFLRGGGVVEVVRPMHNSKFCANCTRLRMTSDGRLKPCLMRDDNLVEAVNLIRGGEPRDVLFKAFEKAVDAREPYWSG